jgi:hypothetical protein
VRCFGSTDASSPKCWRLTSFTAIPTPDILMSPHTSLINNDLARDGCRRRTTKNALSWGERDLGDGLGFLRVNVMLSGLGRVRSFLCCPCSAAWCWWLVPDVRLGGALVGRVRGLIGACGLLD